MLGRAFQKVAAVILTTHQGDTRGLTERIGIGVITARSFIGQAVNTWRLELNILELVRPLGDAVGVISSHPIVIEIIDEDQYHIGPFRLHDP